MNILVLCCFLIMGTACYTQNERVLLPNYSASPSGADDCKFELSYLKQVDSIAQSTGMARHFSLIYSHAMRNVAEQVQSMDSNAMFFIKKFEIRFADYFLTAALDNKNGDLAATSEWQCFFSHPGARPWQLILLGVNTHTNVDFWRSLVDNFSEKEIRRNKKQILACQYSIAKVYYEFFDLLIADKPYVRFINSFTKGLAKKIGERIIYKWRRRNVNLAILFYYDHKKFERRLAATNRKKQQIDRLILRKYKSSSEIALNK